MAIADGEIELSYVDLDSRSAYFAKSLTDRGYKQGDRVAIFAPNCANYMLVLFGLLKGGFVAIPVNCKLHPRELSYILEDSGVRAIVYSEATRLAVDEAAKNLGGVDRISMNGNGTLSVASLTEQSSDPMPWVDVTVQPDDIAWIFYTSGTTGRPKGAMLSHRNLCACTMNALADVCDFRPDDVVLHVAPLSHGSGLYAIPAIARGCQNVIVVGKSFSADQVMSIIRRYNVTIIAFLAPTMIHMLVESDVEGETSSLRRVIYGGAPIDTKLAEKAMERFGRILVQVYGQGEAPMTISCLPAEAHDGRRLSSAGPVRTDVEVRLLDDSDNPVGAGGEGEVCVRGDVVMRGYWNNDAASKETLREGWLHTGDVGRFEDGDLYLLSRKADVIISGGSNIYPREVEDVLLRHDAVGEACVFGEPDPKWGESVVAAVVLRDEVTADELTAFCRSEIASFKKPKRFEFVDSLPKNAYGKIIRREVRRALVRGD